MTGPVAIALSPDLAAGDVRSPLGRWVEAFRSGGGRWLAALRADYCAGAAYETLSASIPRDARATLARALSGHPDGESFQKKPTG